MIQFKILRCNHFRLDFFDNVALLVDAWLEKIILCRQPGLLCRFDFCGERSEPLLCGENFINKGGLEAILAIQNIKIIANCEIKNCKITVVLKQNYKYKVLQNVTVTNVSLFSPKISMTNIYYKLLSMIKSDI